MTVGTDAGRDWSVQVDTGDGPSRVTVRGELDAATAGDLAQHLRGTSSAVVELDLEGVSFIDSSGLAALIEAHQRLAAAQRRLVIAADSPVVRRVLDLSGITDYLDLRSSTAED